MRIAVTGAQGFLGWHTRCALKARGVHEVVAIDRRLMSDSTRLNRALNGVEGVLHLAGVNRASEQVLREENLSLARALTASLTAIGARPSIVFANSIHCGDGSAFGDGKLAASEHLSAWGHKMDLRVSDVMLPNLFGEHGRPHYNSVVATFCHQLALGHTPTVTEDRELPLVHVQHAASEMLRLLEGPPLEAARFSPRPMLVSALLDRLTRFHDLYLLGTIPDVSNPFDLALFNTYRSYCFPAHFPIIPRLHADARGSLFECVRGYGGQTQVFHSSTRPGHTRGQHFHLRKIERFVVLAGTGEIRLRRLFDDRVIRFQVADAQPRIIDMPTMWTHSISNTGETDLMTVFWASEVFNPEDSDTYAEPVEIAEASA